MSIECSRCKVKRKVGITDPLISDLSNYKTCVSCRNKLKEYRRVHLKKKKKAETDKKCFTDDQIEVKIVPGLTDSKKSKVKRKCVEFGWFLDKIYNNVKAQDLVVDEVIQIETFSLPKIVAGITQKSKNIGLLHAGAISDLTSNANDMSDDDELIAREETEEDIPDGSTYLLAEQVIKDETLKANLIESFEVHYVNRVRHVLRSCGYDFKFYVSSWKNGKYYASFRCSEDKNALKRFGAGLSQVELSRVDERSNDISYDVGSSDMNNGTSLLKSKLLDWVEPTDIEPEDLNLKIENEPVNSRFHSSFGYFCESRLNFIVDYSKLEFRVRFAHKHHRLELKYPEMGNQDSKEGWTESRLGSPEKTTGPVEVSDFKPINGGEGPTTPSSAIKETRLSAKLDSLHKTLEL